MARTKRPKDKATARGQGSASLTARQTTTWEFRRVLALINRADIINDIAEQLDSNRSGPRRVLPWRAWFAANILAVMHTNGDAHMTVAQDIFDGFSPSQRYELGIADLKLDYWQLESGLEAIAQGMEERVSKKTGLVLPPRLSMTAHDIGNNIAKAAIPPTMKFSKRLAADSTDVETWATRRSRASLNVLGDAGKLLDGTILDDTSTEVIDGKIVRRSTHVTRGGKVITFPYKGPDGRWVHSLADWARDGYRSGKQMTSKNVFNGADAHLATSTPRDGDDARAALILGYELAPAGSSKAAAGLRLLDRLNAGCDEHAPRFDEVCVDRGYSMAKHENWARPLAERNIVQHHDLGSNERRKAPGDHPGVIFIDGHPFISALPKKLRELRMPARRLSTDESDDLAAKFAERWPYAFSTNGPARDNGSQRYRGPALTGKVRCPNNPRTMSLPYDRPITNCEPGTKCACSLTFTVKVDDERAKHRQPHLYGTPAWSKAYGARNLSESANASLKSQHGKLTRSSIRVLSFNKTIIMLGLIIAATNMRVVRECYGYDEGKPELLPPPGTPILPLPSDQLPTVENNEPPPHEGPPPDHPDSGLTRD